MNLPLQSCAISEKEILSYRVQGSGPAKLVLLHGLASRSETWTDLLPLFPPERYTLYMVDLLGSGASSKPRGADYSMPAHSQRLFEFLERVELSEVTLIGHSLGGAVVLLASIEALRGAKEGLLKSVVVLAGPGYLQSLPLIARLFRRPLAGELFILLPSPKAWVKVGLGAAYYDHRLVDREHIARYAPCYQDRDAKRALVETCRQLVPSDCDAISAWYGRLRLPMLLLWGRQDRIVPLFQGERLEKAVPGARFVVIEECGHNPQEEKPGETFEIIDRFVQEQK
jgi:pimeloyl-ACP methyl ester carboxylesterase